MNQIKAEKMVARLLANAVEIRFGSVAVEAKIHNGRIMDVTHSSTEHSREKADPKEKDE